MALAIVPILMIIIGILIYYLTEKPKEVGRLMMMGGFIGLAISYGTHMVHLG